MMPRVGCPSLRAVVAIFAILVHASYSAGWNATVAGPNAIGAPYALCLAGFGAIDEAPPSERAPSADSLHCQLCLLPAPAAAALPRAAPPVAPQRAVARAGYAPLYLIPPASAAGAAFDARAPPVPLA